MKIASGLNRRKKINTIMDLVFFSPQFILYFIFTLLPFFIALPIIFTSRVNFLDTNVAYVGLENFKSIFQEPIINEYLPAVKRTAVFTLINYATVFVFGMPLALLLFEYVSRLKQGFFSIIFMPYVVSGLGVGMIITMLLSRDSGTLNLLLLKLHIIDKPIDVMAESTAAWALPLFAGWKNAGFNMALFLSGLLSVPGDTIDASKVDGASYWQRFRYVYLPQMKPSIIIATIMCLLGSFGAFDIPVGFGGLRGNRSANFLAVLLYQMGFSGGETQTGTLAQAVTISLVTYLPLVIIAIFINRYQRKITY